MENTRKITELMPVDVIVFSRQRQAKLIRSFRLWSTQPFQFIVLDNSTIPLQTQFPSNVNYYHLPDTNYGSRANEALKYLRNPYSIICSDDENLIPNSIHHMLDFLEKNKNFASVGGKVIAVYKYGPRLIGAYTYKYMYGYVNTEDDLSTRLKKHFEQDLHGHIPIGGMYRLFRKEGMNSLLNTFYVARNVSTPYIFQILGEIVSTSLGPNHTIDSVYWIRNWNNEISSHIDWNRNKTFSSWWNNGINQSEKNELLTKICNLNGIDFYSLYDILDQIASKLSIPDKKVSTHNFRRPKFSKILKHMSMIKFVVKKLSKPKSLPISIQDMLNKESHGLPPEEKKQIIDGTRNMLS
jgi:glycosyltransferase domain-containing protein